MHVLLSCGVWVCIFLFLPLGFMRLINRLGFDRTMCDIDVIILKNPIVVSPSGLYSETTAW